ncbi:hypothetical protein Bca4012_019519 [Brassica carinata]
MSVRNESRPWRPQPNLSITNGSLQKNDHWIVTGAGKLVSNTLEPQKPLLRLTPHRHRSPCSTSSLREPKGRTSVRRLLHLSSNRLTASGESRSSLKKLSRRVMRRCRGCSIIDRKRGKTESTATASPKSRLPPPSFFLGPRRLSIRSRNHLR